MIQSTSIATLVAALRKAQKEFPVIKRDTVNPHFKSKYATLDGVIDSLAPTLDANGLMIFQPAVADPANKCTGVTTAMYHESGEFMMETLLLPNTTTGGDAGNAQSATGCVTYARRTGYLSMCGVTSEDDDGNTAVGNSRETQQKTAPARAAAPPAKAQTANPTKTAAPTSAPAKASTSPATAPSTAAATTAAPAQPTTSATSLNFADASIPTEDQLATYRANVKLLGDDLAEAGLKKSTGLPINRKILSLVKAVVGQSDATKITVSQWQQFFDYVRTTKEQVNGVKQLVEFVEKANA